MNELTRTRGGHSTPLREAWTISLHKHTPLTTMSGDERSTRQSAASAVVALAAEESSMAAIVGLGVVALRAAAMRLDSAWGASRR